MCNTAYSLARRPKLYFLVDRRIYYVPIQKGKLLLLSKRAAEFSVYLQRKIFLDLHGCLV